MMNEKGLHLLLAASVCYPRPCKHVVSASVKSCPATPGVVMDRKYADQNHQLLNQNTCQILLYDIQTYLLIPYLQRFTAYAV